jgi:(R,R)-butanediol dehydrogenase/meso-butanediol dehydrogenase/diacetyl reductase
MRAAVVNEEKSFDIVEVPDPSPGAGELVLRVHACGICGSDLKAVHNMRAGLVMGHEFCGEIVAVGDGVADLRTGQRVSALPLIGCGRCVSCATGDVAHCPTVDMVGVGGSSGGYAEYVRVAASEAVVLPDALAFDQGALVEPLAVGLHAIERAHVTPADDVLVVGAGPVGLAVSMWARLQGARSVTVSDPVAGRRAAAVRAGASATIDPTSDGIDRTYPVVVECVGTPGMIATAIGATAVHGRLVVAGVCTKPDTFVPVVAMMKELTMHFVVYYRRQDFHVTVDALAQQRLPIDGFVTGTVGLDGFAAAFAALSTPTDQCKVLVHPAT